MWKITDIYKETSGFYLKPDVTEFNAIDEELAELAGCWHKIEFTWLWLTIILIKNTP